MKVLLIGNGAVGTALAEIIRRYHDLTVYDKEAATVKDESEYDVMHICYPWHTGFAETTINYIQKFSPELTLIESTVKPQTTQTIFCSTPHDSKYEPKLICHSPVRGLHVNLRWGLESYTKFIGPTSLKAGLIAERYYQSLKMKTHLCAGSTESECMKLFNLSYYASQIAFFQEVERKAKEYGICYSDVIKFFESTTEQSDGQAPRPVFKGNNIGGTCVMPGLRLMFNPTKMWAWIEESNKKTP